MSLRVIIVYIFCLIVVEVEGIAIVDATPRSGCLMWHGLEQRRSSIIFSSLAAWKKVRCLINSHAIHGHSCHCRRHPSHLIAFRSTIRVVR